MLPSSIPPRRLFGRLRSNPDDMPTRVQVVADATPVDAEPPVGSGRRRAVVWSDESEGRRLRLRLGSLGFRVELVDDKAGLLDAVRRGPVDLVLLDRCADEAAIVGALTAQQPALGASVLVLGPGPRPSVGRRLGAKPTSRQLREAVEEACGQTPALRPVGRKEDPGLEPGEVIADRFAVISRLGSGSAAHVYRVRDRVQDAEVALKLLRDSCRDPVGEQRLQRELSILRRLRHPGIVQPYEFGDWNGQPWFTMELLRGKSLHQALRDQGAPLSGAQVQRLARLLADALAAAHAAGVIHRDVKPGNVFVEGGGGVRLMDFGIATTSEASVRLSATGQILGTPAYVAPELLLRGAATPAVDLFGLGVLLYLAATRTLPFQGKTLAEIGHAICHGRPELPSAHNPALDREVDGLILALLAKDPARRPTAAQVVSLLGRGRRRAP